MARARPREPPIAPGTGAQLVVPGRMLDSLRSVSERTCGKSIPPEVQIGDRTSRRAIVVAFRDGLRTREG